MLVQTRWTAPMRFEAEVDSGHRIVMDVPEGKGGTDAGPTPMETVLSALTACSGMDVAGILRKMRAPLEGLRITAEAERAPEYPKVFTRIRVRYEAWGAGLEADQVRRAVELSLGKYCSVSAMLRHTVAITSQIFVGPKREELAEMGSVTAA